MIAHARKGDGGVERDPLVGEQTMHEAVEALADHEGPVVDEVSHLVRPEID